LPTRADLKKKTHVLSLVLTGALLELKKKRTRDVEKNAITVYRKGIYELVSSSTLGRGGNFKTEYCVVSLDRTRKEGPTIVLEPNGGAVYEEALDHLAQN